MGWGLPPPVQPLAVLRTRLTDVLHRRCSTGACQGRLGLAEQPYESAGEKQRGAVQCR
jgi:hypothetical protein